MSLVADYRSSDGSEEEKSVSSNGEALKEKGRKKKRRNAKKLKKTFFLPPEIQDALANGGDSESDEERNASVVSCRGKDSSNLLAMLPPPRQSSSIDKDKFKSLTISKPHSVTQSERMNVSRVKAIDDADRSKTFDTKAVEEVTETPSEDEDRVQASSEDMGSEANSNTIKPLLTLAPPKTIDRKVFVPTRVAVVPRQCTDEVHSDVFYATESIPSSAIRNQETNDHRQSVNEYACASHGSTAFQSAEGQSEFERSNSRKRLRDAELKFLNGQLQDGLADISAAVIDYQGNDPSEYNPFFEGGASTVVNLTSYDVSGQRYNPQTGETDIVRGASRGQKRKHQINSLAAEAASKELEIMDKRAAGYRTKAQTQAKYGW